MRRWNPGGAGRRAIRCALLAALFSQTACLKGPAGPTTPSGGDPSVIVVEGVYAPDLARLVDVADGTHAWRWRAVDASTSSPATLTIAGPRWSWRLVGNGSTEAAGPSRPDMLALVPEDPDVWHGFETPADTCVPGAWLPLPRMALDSPFYYDLLDLLQHLIAPRFDLRVCHWYRRPVPVG